MKMGIGIDVLGLCNMRCSEESVFWSVGCRIISTRTAKDEPGIPRVTIVLTKSVDSKLEGYVQLNDRIILVITETKPKGSLLVQAVDSHLATQI